MELDRNPFNQPFWDRRNGKQSSKLPEATAPKSPIRSAGG